METMTVAALIEELERRPPGDVVTLEVRDENGRQWFTTLGVDVDDDPDGGTRIKSTEPGNRA